MTLKAMPSSRVASDGSCLVVFTGPANRTVLWNLTGAGTLTIISEVTDALGVALAKYTPGTAGTTVTITVDYVP